MDFLELMPKIAMQTQDRFAENVCYIVRHANEQSNPIKYIIHYVSHYDEFGFASIDYKCVSSGNDMLRCILNHLEYQVIEICDDGSVETLLSR